MTEGTENFSLEEEDNENIFSRAKASGYLVAMIVVVTIIVKNVKLMRK